MEVKIKHDALDHALAYHAAEQNNQSDTLSFRLPRHRGSLDLGALSPSLFLMREDGSADVIRPADDNILTVKTTDDTVTVTWTLTGWATAIPGELYYQLVFRSNEEEPARYATFPAKLTILRSIAAEEVLVSSYPTFFWQWEQEMGRLRDEAGERLEQVAEWLEAVKYPAVTAAKGKIPSDLAQTDLPDSVTAPGSYYGFASDWSLNGESISGNYFLTVEQNNPLTAANHIRVQTFFFYTLGRVFTRFLDERTATEWSDFIEITQVENEAEKMVRSYAENGFLYNIYADGSIIYGGRTCEETTAQTYLEARPGDTNDVYVSGNGAPLWMVIGGTFECPDGIVVHWTGNDDTPCYPVIRTRMGKFTTHLMLGLDYYCKRKNPLTINIELYACPLSMGTQVMSFGTYRLTLLNDGRIHHLRIPFADFGIMDGQLPEGATSVCCKISWSNAQDQSASGDEFWFSNLCYYDRKI